MKVNKYQIEVMWLFLAAMFCRMTNETEVVYTDSYDRKKGYYTKNYNIEKIRPPP